MVNGSLVDAHRPHPANPLSLFITGWEQRKLILQLTRREILGRYRGSMMGVTWSLLYPIMMLAVYTFVFSVVFEAKWPGLYEGQSRSRFALLLFAGVIAHGMLAEAITKAPMLVVGNASYVKKVVFPLETLAWTLGGSAAFHAAASLGILLLAKWALEGWVPLTALWLPVILLPLALFALGFTFLFAAIGAFVRDLAQVTGVLATLLLFIAPVFYPITALPEQYRWWVAINPLTLPIEQGRAALFAMAAPDLRVLGAYYLLALAFLAMGYWVFQKSRRGFADVL